MYKKQLHLKNLKSKQKTLVIYIYVYEQRLIYNLAKGSVCVLIKNK